MEKCTCKLKLKAGYSVMTSQFVSVPVNLLTLPQNKYEFFYCFWPDAFERPCNCRVETSKKEK